MPKAPRLKAGARVASRVAPDGLRFTYSPDGLPATVIDLTSWPGSEVLKQQAVQALTRLTADDGRWRAKKTVDDALTYVRGLLRWCDAQGIETFADLDHEALKGLEAEQQARRTQSSHHRWTRTTRTFLREVPELPAGVRMAARERVGSPDDDGTRDYYTTEQMRDIERQALRVVSRARRRVTANHRLVEQALAGDAEATPAQHMLLKIWNDEYERKDYERRMRLLGAPEPVTGAATADHFFMLTQEEVAAAAALLVCRTGWNRSVVEMLTTGSWAASAGEEEQIATVSTDKRRRGARRHSTDVLVDRGGESQGAAWRIIIEATAPARAYLSRHGVTTDALLLRSAHGRPGVDEWQVLHRYVRRGLPEHLKGRQSWLPGGVTLDFPALRRTRQTLVDRTPTHNTFKTHVQSYLMLNPEVQDEMYATAADGLATLIDRAEESLGVRLEAEADLPEQLADGSKDTATVACKDINHHPVTGLPCTDSFLACLMCQNAVATPRHLPRLVLLHAAMEDQRGAVTEAAWGDLRDHHLRLTAFLFNSARLTEQTYRQHLQAATEADRRNVRDLLGGNLDA